MFSFYNKRAVCLISIDPNCNNGVKDQGETDVDCGGVCVAQGKQCNNGQNCSYNADCKSNTCSNGICVSKYFVFSRNVRHILSP